MAFAGRFHTNKSVLTEMLNNKQAFLSGTGLPITRLAQAGTQELEGKCLLQVGGYLDWILQYSSISMMP